MNDLGSLTLLNGRTLTATLTQSLLCMSEALALIVQQAGISTVRLSGWVIGSLTENKHRTASSYTLTWTQWGQRDEDCGVHESVWKKGLPRFYKMMDKYLVNC